MPWVFHLEDGADAGREGGGREQTDGETSSDVAEDDDEDPVEATSTASTLSLTLAVLG